MRVCVVTFVECWQDESGNWLGAGGFPLQMFAIGSLFDDMTMLVVRGTPRAGGTPLPKQARVVPLRRPAGENFRRKLSVLIRLPYYLGKIARHVRAADVVSIAVPGDLPLLGLLTALGMRKRLFVRYESSWETTAQTTVMNRLTKWCVRSFAGGRNVMVVTGAAEAPPAPNLQWLFATSLSAAEMTQLPLTLDRGLSRPPRLIYAGRLSPEKGLETLVKALSILKSADFPSLPIVTLAGDGPSRRPLEALAKRLGCEALITFAGQLNRTDLARHLVQADLCVHPSLTEGFSKAWLDAMAHGLPIIASQVGAASAVVGGRGCRGWLVPPGDVSALVHVLGDVLNSPTDWPAIRNRCRQYVENKTLEAWAKRIGDLCAEHWNLRLCEGKLTP